MSPAVVSGVGCLEGSPGTASVRGHRIVHTEIDTRPGKFQIGSVCKSRSAGRFAIRCGKYWGPLYSVRLWVPSRRCVGQRAALRVWVPYKELEPIKRLMSTLEFEIND